MRQLLVMAAAGLLLGGSAMPPSAAETLDPIDLQACRLLASTDDLGDIVVQSAALDLDGDGRLDRVQIAYEGTGHYPSPQFALAGGDFDYTSLAEPDSYTDHDGWMQGAAWLVYGGRAYGVGFTGRGKHYLRYVTRLDGKGAEHPVCQFEPHVAVSLDPATASDKSICSAVSSGKVSYVAAQRQAKPTAVPDREVLAATTRAIAQATVDFANTGKPAAMYLYSADSTAGAGCQIRYYDTAPTDNASLGHAQLSALQGLDVTRFPYPGGGCYDGEPRWFTLNGVTYLESRSIAASKPTGEEYEYHTVDVIQRGLPRRVCDALYVHSVTLVGVWQDGKWVAPPPGSTAPR